MSNPVSDQRRTVQVKQCYVKPSPLRNGFETAAVLVQPHMVPNIIPQRMKKEMPLGPICIGGMVVGFE